MALFGSIATVRAQLTRSDHFNTAFAYLDECFRAGSDAHRRIQGIPVGKTERIELTGGVFSMEQVYLGKPRSEGFFESHRAYIDIQVLFSGEEYLEVTDISHLRVKEDRTPEHDVIIYEMTGSASVLRLRGGEGAVFFPVDGHMPSLAIKEPTVVRKIVVKIPVA
jgi:YhcH/YjgK/YiaL family protein